MNGQVGNHGNRALEVDQLAFHLAIAAVRDTTGQGQVAVEPGRQQGTAIHLNAELEKTLFLQFWLWLDPQARTVSVCADQADTAFQWRALA